jgi:hypothetical protein
MNNRKKITACAALFAVLLIVSCDWEIPPSDDKIFDHDLRGTWVSNDPSVYFGQLIIEKDRITITGFTEGQTQLGGDDNRRPFRGFTRGAALTGYSEEGKIFIEDRGLLQEGIPFHYYTAGTFPQERFLSFTFGGRIETLQRQR